MSAAEQIANHSARIGQLETSARDDRASNQTSFQSLDVKIDKLRYWIMGILISALVSALSSLGGIAFSLLKK